MVVMVDSGAEFSSISTRLVHKYNIRMHKPSKGISYFIGAASGMRTERKGFVIITVTAHFTLGGVREVVTFDKQFEVVDLPGEDFIIGQDLNPELFPDDAAIMFGAKWASQMTTWPTNIRRWSSEAPRAAAVAERAQEGDAMAQILTEEVGEDMPIAAPPVRFLAVTSPSESDSE